MNPSHAARTGEPHRSFASALCFLAITIALLGVLAANAATPAKAETLARTFCSGWLDPAWTGTYRCDAPDSLSGYNRQNVGIRTVERAGCVDYADVWHNLITSWVCTPSNTEKIISIRQDGGWYRGVIRNNNLSYRGQFVGSIWWSE